MDRDNYYDSIAEGYDELHEEEQLKKLEVIKKNMPSEFKNIQSLLDVGCGSGISTRHFNAEKRYGIDPSKELIKIARKKDLKGNYKVENAENMDFKEKFDLIISITAIQNFENIEKGLDNIRRYGDKFILTFLKKSGKRKDIEKTIKKKFKIIKELEENKDIIYFCR